MTITAIDTGLTAEPDPVGLLADSALLLQLESAFAERRQIDATIARLSGEIASRSRNKLGSDSLARRHGSATAPALVASIGLIGNAEANRFCRVGIATGVRRSLSGEALPPAFEVIASTLKHGHLSIEAAHHIVTQLERARPRASIDDLTAAERELIRFAVSAVADDVRRLAIRWRDALDADGIEPREEALVAARSLKRVVLPNGMKRFVLDLDPLSAAYLDTAIDTEVTAAIRKVRFVGAEAAEPGTGDLPSDGDLGTEARTVAQLGADAVVDLARHGLSCENSAPALAAVTVVIRMSEEALVSGVGEARIDGGELPISAATARRLAADGEIIPMVLGGESEVLDLGRSRRLFSRARRIAFAERDGGCAMPGCDRPPNFAEAHHLRWWTRDHGSTDLDNGVLLCARDHPRVHAEGWDIRVEKGGVWFIPPPSIDPRRRPRRGGRLPTPMRK